MSTISTIGTSSRNYSTIGAWLTAFAAGGWIGECYNDSEFNENLSFSGHATSATDYIILRAATGQSAFENSANHLRYDQSQGVGLNSTTNYAPNSCVVYVNENYVTLQKLQIKASGVGNSVLNGAKYGVVGAAYDRLLVHNAATFGTAGYVLQISGGSIATNCCFITARYNAVSIYYGNTGTFMVNCIVAMPTDSGFYPGGYGIVPTGNGGSSTTVQNCAIFGFGVGSIYTGSYTIGGDYNASDVTLPMGTNNQASKTYANQFLDTTTATLDLRLKSGADCIDAGMTDTTHIASIDIYGTSRPQGTTWDIGPFEFAAIADTLFAQALL